MRFNPFRLAPLSQPGQRGQWRGEILAIFVLLAVGGFFFWPILIGRTHFIALGDTSDLILPYEIEIQNYLKQGIFPLWAPHSFDGFPTVGYPQLGMFYPFGLLIFWIGAVCDIDPVNIYAYHFIFHIVLFSIGNYWFARTLKMGRVCSLVAAVGSSYAPAILVFDVWGNSLPGFSWWGFTLAALVLAQEGERRRGAYIAIAGLALGQSILAAPSQPAIQLIFLVAALFIAQALPLLREFRRLAGLFGRYVTVAVIGLSIGTLALLPVLEFSNQSVRFLGKFGATPTNEKMGFAAFTDAVLSAKNASGFLIHELSSVAVGSNFIGAFLILGVILAVANCRRVRGSYVWYLVATSTAAMLYAFNLGLPRLFYAVPGLNLIREPDRYCQIFVFTVSFLAALGLEAVLRGEDTKFLRRHFIAGLIFAVLAALMLGLAATGLPAKTLAPYISESVAALCWLALAVAFRTRVRSRPVMAAFFLLGTVWTMSAIPYNQVSFRDYDPHADIASAHRMTPLRPTGPEPFRVFAMHGNTTAQTYNANAASVAGFYDVFGYHNPILLRSLRAYNMSYMRPLYLSLLNVRYVVTSPETVAAAKKIIGYDAGSEVRLPDLLVHDGNWKSGLSDMAALENPNRYGAAWLVDRYEVVDRPWTNREEIDGSSDPESLMLKTEAAGFDPAKEAVVDRLPHLQTGRPLASSSDEPMSKVPVEWQKYGPNSFKMLVNAPKDALLVVSELWYPGWRATVNGKAAEIVRADWLLRAVAVPAGPAVVRFEYRPTSLVIGAVACLFGLMLAFVLLSLPRFNRRHYRTV